MKEINASRELVAMNLVGSTPDEKDDHIFACHDALRSLADNSEREVARLTAQLADMTADRDGYRSAYDGAAESLRAYRERLGKEIDRLTAELAERPTIEERDLLTAGLAAAQSSRREAIHDGIAAWKARQKEGKQ